MFENKTQDDARKEILELVKEVILDFPMTSFMSLAPILWQVKTIKEKNMIPK